MPEALINRAYCLWTCKKDLAGAIDDLERAVRSRPEYPGARGDLLLLKMHAADWRNLARERAALDEGVRAGKRVVQPYVYQALSSSPASSVLWLLENNSLVTTNLRRETASAGVDPARLVFAPQLEISAHLARLALGDLFLDSLPCNAHTTASDALWAGLPLITCRGQTFAGRVAASLLRAVGLPELITDNLDEYESLALKLTEDRARLQSYRDHLTRDPLRLPLFDTARTTRQIEAAYEGMVQRWMKDSMPEAFEVPA